MSINYKIINLTQGMSSVVDEEEFNNGLFLFKWHINRSKNKVYAEATILKKNIKMHRLITNCPKGMTVDHINGDTLDNRKCNLRICTKNQNNLNVKKHKSTLKTTSKYKGVSYAFCIKPNGKKYKRNKPWKSVIRYNKKDYNLGYFNNEIDAAKAYDKAALKYHGEFANLNFKDSK